MNSSISGSNFISSGSIALGSPIELSAQAVTSSVFADVRMPLELAGSKIIPETSILRIIGDVEKINIVSVAGDSTRSGAIVLHVPAGYRYDWAVASFVRKSAK
jgi:hypothetical protein